MAAFHPDIFVFDTLEKLQHAAADLIISIAQRKSSRTSIALSGGSTPQGLYKLLHAEHAEAMRGKFTYFLGDERMVPHDDPDSNYGNARAHLLHDIPMEHVHPIDTSVSPAEAATSYCNVLQSALLMDGGVPQLDILLLGLGPDGHTLSLFPDTPAALETVRTVITGTPGPEIKPQVPRVTMTKPVVHKALNVIVLATGADKKWVVDAICADTAEEAGSLSPTKVAPVSRLLRACTGKVTFLLDESIAGRTATPS